MDLATGMLTRQLTSEAYNEHAYYSLDGTKIVWMTNLQSTLGGCDWWIMNADGSGKDAPDVLQRAGDPTSTGQAVWCGDTAWFPDGRSFLGSVQTDLVSGAGKIVKVSVN
jgi:Tol biopolymer transport system component